MDCWKLHHDLEEVRSHMHLPLENVEDFANHLRESCPSMFKTHEQRIDGPSGELRRFVETKRDCDFEFQIHELREELESGNFDMSNSEEFEECMRSWLCNPRFRLASVVIKDSSPHPDASMTAHCDGLPRFTARVISHLSGMPTCTIGGEPQAEISDQLPAPRLEAKQGREYVSGSRFTVLCAPQCTGHAIDVAHLIEPRQYTAARFFFFILSDHSILAQLLEDLWLEGPRPDIGRFTTVAEVVAEYDYYLLGLEGSSWFPLLERIILGLLGDEPTTVGLLFQELFLQRKVWICDIDVF